MNICKQVVNAPSSSLNRIISKDMQLAYAAYQKQERESKLETEKTIKMEIKMPDIFTPDRGSVSGRSSPPNSRFNQNMNNWRKVRLNRMFHH